MPDYMKDAREFTRKYGFECNGNRPRALPKQLSALRQRLLTEEVREYKKACADLEDAVSGNVASLDDEVAFQLSQALDALVDIAYVAMATAAAHGFNMDEAWSRVHAANMSKITAKSKSSSKRKSKQDVIKPPGWEAPRLQDLVINHAHKE